VTGIRLLALDMCIDFRGQSLQCSQAKLFGDRLPYGNIGVHIPRVGVVEAGGLRYYRLGLFSVLCGFYFMVLFRELSERVLVCG
jgi:hypothetical protein